MVEKMNAAKMREVFRRWSESGLSLRAFGIREGLSYSVLLYWRKRFRAEEGPRKEAIELTPVNVIETRPVEPRTISVRLANGVSLEVPEDADLVHLREMIGVLSSC